MGVNLGCDRGGQEGRGLIGDYSIKVVVHGLLDTVRPLDHTRVGNEGSDVWGMVGHKACDGRVLHDNMLPSKPSFDVKVGTMYAFIDYHVMGSLNEALAVDDIGFPVVLGHGEVMEFDTPQAGGLGVGGSVTVCEEIPERFKGIVNAAQVRLFVGEEVFEGGHRVCEECSTEAVVGVSEEVGDEMNPLGTCVGEVCREHGPYQVNSGGGINVHNNGWVRVQLGKRVWLFADRRGVEFSVCGYFGREEIRGVNV